MSYLVHTIYYFLALVPGLPARAHLWCGRMGLPLRIVMGLAGIVITSAAGLGAFLVHGGVKNGVFGYFPASGLWIVAAFLLINGATATARALRNPLPPALPENVIAFRRPVEQTHSSVGRYPW